jgi:hypothetical protein
MEINGKKYKVISRKRVSGFMNRWEFTLMLERGNRCYHAVQYEDGSISSVV